MKFSAHIVQRLGELTLMGSVVLLVALAIWAVQSQATAPSQATGEAVVEPYPGPHQTLQPAAPETAIVLGTDEYLELPSATPFPTPTPWPTATRRPGPTATALPLLAPASDASGKLYYAEMRTNAIRRIEVDGVGHRTTEAIALPVSFDFEPSIGGASPDGRYMLVLRPAFPAAVPYVVNTDTSAVFPLFRTDVQGDIRGVFHGWHPNSRQVLFSQDHHALWLVDVETGEVTDLAYDVGPPRGAAISPDGLRVVYIGVRRSYVKTVLMTSSAGADARQIFDVTEGEIISWSPDGTTLLFTGGPGLNKDGTPMVPPSSSYLWLMAPDGSHQRPIDIPAVHVGAGGLLPLWSPDSQWLAFTGAEPISSFGCYNSTPPPDEYLCQFDSSAVYVVQVDSMRVTRLAPGIAGAWSPDGTRIAYLSNESGAPEIWTIRLDGTDPQQFTDDGRPKRTTVIWSPQKGGGMARTPHATMCMQLTVSVVLGVFLAIIRGSNSNVSAQAPTPFLIPPYYGQEM
jgi:dipeptidyl aminopeptidase/acylaminoacyl peptidase